MKTYYKLYFIGFLCLLVTTGSFAQMSSLYAGIGIASLRGETTDEPIFKEDYGSNFSVKYFTPLRNGRWVVGAEVSSANIALEHQALGYQSRLSQNYLGVGMRFYLSEDADAKKGFMGNIIPFAGLSIGALHSIRTNNQKEISTEISYKTPPKDPFAHYELTHGSSMEFNGQAEAGIVYVLGTQWRLEASCRTRRGFTDNWDGIQGIGKGNDWFISGGLGMHFLF